MRRALGSAAAVVMTVGLLSAPTATAAPLRTDHAAPGRIQDLRVVRTSSTSVTLRWANPSGAATATEVREIRGDGLPASHRAGRHVARVGRTHHTVIVPRLASGTRYEFALFATDGHGHFSARTATHATTSPGPVTSLRAFEQDDDIQLQWRLPSTPTLDHLVARVRKGDVAPTTSSGGRRIALGGSRPTSTTIAALRKGTTYSISVFALDRAGRSSTPSITRVTTLADPADKGAVTGRVTDRAGNPLSGVSVTTSYNGAARGTAHTTTGADGRYTLALRQGHRFLSFGGQHITGGTTDGSGYLPGFAEPTVRAGTTTRVSRTALDPGAAVSGRLVDASGTPVPGATVNANSVNSYVDVDADFDGGGVSTSFSGGAALDNSSTTSSDGRFVLRGIGGPSAVRVCADPNADREPTVCSRTTVLPVIGRIRPMSDLIMSTAPTGTVSVHVHGGGQDLRAVQVAVEQLGNSDGLGFGYGQTDRSGTTQQLHLPSGRYSVCASHDRVGPTGFAGRCDSPVRVIAGHVVSIDLALHVGAAITGTITGPTGKPVPGVYVGTADKRGEGDYASTNAHGRYVLRGLTPSAHRVCASGSDEPSRSAPTGVLARCVQHKHAIAVRTGAVRADINLRMPAGAAISGVVRDSAGRGVPNALVTVDPHGSYQDSNNAAVFTDAHGRYVVGGLVAGRVNICAERFPNGTGAFSISFFSSAAGEDCAGTIIVGKPGTTTRADVHIPEATGISVTVRDRSGAPIAGVNAAALEPCTGHFCDREPLFDRSQKAAVAASEVSLRNGTARLDALQPGHYVLCLYAYYGTTSSGGSPTGYADRCSGSTFDISVTAGRVTPVALVLGDGGAVSGRVTDSAGAPLGDVAVIVPASAGTDYPGADGGFGFDDPLYGSPASNAVTAADGTYTIFGVQPGRRSVCMDADEATGGAAGPGYLDQCIGGAPGAATSTARVSVTAGSTTFDADLALTTGAALAGTVHVTTPDVQYDAEVEVFAGRSDTTQVAVVNVHSSGRWVTPALPAGLYTVCVDSYDNVSQCYRGVTWPGSAKAPPLARATLITATAGTTTSGIDATLTRRHRGQ